MINKSQPEPVTIIVSTALTALAVGLIGKYNGTWVNILLTLIFFFSGKIDTRYL
ncbi:hypothetical protein [Crocosphaera sp.]|uniref:hypothetical protein n=1 Tax=Crocosphaera sp. TaxID=2729996 RepID=UPI003F25EBB2|nr:hypothetical protein [Crocosphaera sp.]